jgi:hypothetical protein
MVKLKPIRNRTYEEFIYYPVRLTGLTVVLNLAIAFMVLIGEPFPAIPRAQSAQHMSQNASL